MKILIGFERSGVVRRVFRDMGHEAYSCDIVPADDGGPHHLQRDIREIFGAWNGWDLGIFFPPCTYLAVSGARWFKDRQKEQEEALDVIRELMELPYPHSIENPIGVISTRIRKPDQIIQPWMFGHGETKATCLWLKDLPLLKPTNIVEGRENRIHKMPPSKDRGRLRSITYSGIAEAMAEQWG